MNSDIRLNEHSIGIILKELVRRSIIAIRNERMVFQATAKEGYAGGMDDVFTSADIKAQKIFEKSIKECFPGIGIIGEEGLKHKSGKDFSGTYFTIDPLDGTKAFVRRQSHGSATMVALVDNGEVISAWIGDINTEEIYGYRPLSDIVHRITEYDTAEDLSKFPWGKPLEQHCLLMRDYPEDETLLDKKTRKMFEKILVDGSSIGTWFARLWKGEVGALHMRPGKETPWDSSPIIGISLKLGFVFMRPSAEGWEEYTPPLVTDVIDRDHQIIVVHKKYIGQLKNMI